MLTRFFGYFFSLIMTVFLVGLCCAGVLISNATKNLPDYDSLKNYTPDLMTRIHAENGELIGEVATEKRLYLPIESIPQNIKLAFISAEDKNFYKHFGIDPEGLARAIVTDVKYFLQGRRLIGASTITQQVAKNLLLSSDLSIERKLKEAILAVNMEKTYSKDHILELYLNKIYLGRGAYGVAAAALTYFNKSVNDLKLSEIAYLASLPKGPSNYDPFKHKTRALERRNWVIDRMFENGYITKNEADTAKLDALGVSSHIIEPNSFATDYFVEEVRKELMSQYGADKVYGGGFSVRTTLNQTYQKDAQNALRRGLIKIDQEKGWRGAHAHLEFKNNWKKDFANIEVMQDIPQWNLAVVFSVTNNNASIFIQPQIDLAGKFNSNLITGIIQNNDSLKWAYRILSSDGTYLRKAKGLTDILHVGDVIYVQKTNDSDKKYTLQQVPQVQGAILAMDPRTGRVLAMVGGFSFSQSEFNRASQAYRQPGSAFKPIVYAAALDHGYTPASVVLDGPLEIDQPDGSVWKPKNYEGTYDGPATLRHGIEHSRNLMTVRLANDLGMNVVADYAKRFGVYDKMQPVLSMSLGAGDTTLLKMVTAYAIFANKGQAISPTYIDRIQNRYGKTIYKHDTRTCENCNVAKWENQEEPVPTFDKEQVLDPMTAYQITSMLEGVIERGTGRSLQYLHKHIAGKTGTTNDSKDAWFIGYTPNIVVGVYVGYDQPKNLGFGGTGARLAAPIFGDFFATALKNQPDIPFQIPDGMSQIPINPKTGMRAEDDADNSIIEAFKPGTGPADTYQVIGNGSAFREGVRVGPLSETAQDAIENGLNGLY